MPTAVQLLLDRHGAKAPRDDGSELPAGFGIIRRKSFPCPPHMGQDLPRGVLGPVDIHVSQIIAATKHNMLANDSAVFS